MPFLIAIAAIGGSAVADPVGGQGTWETTLKARDINGYAVALDDPRAAFFFDSTLNITWLADMKAASGSSFDDGWLNWDGLLTRSAARAWADALTLAGKDDWRLPAILNTGSPLCDLSYGGGTDCGYNVQTEVGGRYSELAYLYYVTLGNLAYCPPGSQTDPPCEIPQNGWGLTNTAHFTNLQPLIFWSGTEQVLTSSVGTDTFTFTFSMNGGIQLGGICSTCEFSAVAVRDGDVLVASVPEPATSYLAFLALASVVATQHRRRAAPVPAFVLA